MCKYHDDLWGSMEKVDGKPQIYEADSMDVGIFAHVYNCRECLDVPITRLELDLLVSGMLWDLDFKYNCYCAIRITSTIFPHRAVLDSESDQESKVCIRSESNHFLFSSLYISTACSSFRDTNVFNIFWQLAHLWNCIVCRYPIIILVLGNILPTI
jgi:hypothetical protein